MRCPICSSDKKRELDAPRPFCSARCKKLDFDRWIGGAYAIPGEPVDQEQAEEAS